MFASCRLSGLRVAIVAVMLVALPAPAVADGDLSLDAFTDKLNGMVGNKIAGQVKDIDAKLAANPSAADRAKLVAQKQQLKSLEVRLSDEKIVRAWWNAIKSSKDAVKELAKEAELGYKGDSAINIGFFSAKNIKGLDFGKLKGAWNSSEKYIAALDGLSSDLGAIETSGLSPATKKLAGAMTALTRIMSTFGDKVPLIGDFIALYGNVGGDILKAAMALDKKIEASEGGQIMQAGMHGARIEMSEKLAEQGLGTASYVSGLRDVYTSTEKGLIIWDRKAGNWVVVAEHENVSVAELTKRYLYFAKKGNKAPTPQQLLRGYKKTVVITLTPSKTNILPKETITLTVGGHLVSDESKSPKLEVEIKAVGNSGFGSGTFGGNTTVKIGDSLQWTAPDNVNEYYDFTADLAEHVVKQDIARSNGKAKARVRTGAGSKIELVARPTSVGFGGKVEVTAKVFTVDGQPLDAKASGYIDFSVKPARAGGSGGYFQNFKDTTDQKGATRTWTAPDQAGTFEITASYAGATSGVFFTANTAGSSAQVSVTVEPPRFSITVDEAVKNAKKDAPAEFTVTIKNEEPADPKGGEQGFTLQTRWGPKSQRSYWARSISEKVFWIKGGAEKQVTVRMKPTDEEEATTYKAKIIAVPRGATDKSHAKSVILTAVHKKKEGAFKVVVTGSGKDGKAQAGGKGKLERMAKSGDTIALSFRPWGKRRKYCTVDVVKKSKNMRQVVLNSSGPNGCDFGTSDGRMSTSWKVTEEKVTWSGPGVTAGNPSYKATFKVPDKPGNYVVNASGTVKWHQDSKRAGGRVTNDESESGSGSFTIKVVEPQ